MYSKKFLEWAKKQIPQSWETAYLAMDSSGTIWMYNCKPYLETYYWVSGTKIFIESMKWVQSEFRNSLYMLKDKYIEEQIRQKLDDMEWQVNDGGYIKKPRYQCLLKLIGVKNKTATLGIERNGYKEINCEIKDLLNWDTEKLCSFLVYN